MAVDVEQSQDLLLDSTLVLKSEEDCSTAYYMGWC